jgi:hypothetical protein
MSFFEKITDGLHLYEVIILVLGSLMFLALIIMMIIYASQRRTLKPLFMFFGVPVLMLVWPSIQKIKIDSKGAEIEKQVAEVQKNPSEENKEKLQGLVEDVENRDVKNPDVKKDVAKAYFILGNNKAAEATIHTLSPKDTADPKITDIRKSIAVSHLLQQQILEVKQNPTDSNKVKELNKTQIEATQLEVKNPEVTNNIKVANQQVTNYQRINPRVRMTTTIPH